MPRIDNYLFSNYPELTDELLTNFGAYCGWEPTSTYHKLMRELLYATADNFLALANEMRAERRDVDTSEFDDTAAVVLAWINALDAEPDSELGKFRREIAARARTACRSHAIIESEYDEAVRLRSGLATCVERGDSLERLVRWTAAELETLHRLRQRCPVYHHWLYWGDDGTPEHEALLARLRRGLVTVVDDRLRDRPTNYKRLVQRVLASIGWDELSCKNLWQPERRGK